MKGRNIVFYVLLKLYNGVLDLQSLNMYVVWNFMDRTNRTGIETAGEACKSAATDNLKVLHCTE